ncbi:MAG: hypothetical protein DLM50_02395 [Candidatus Meridianibacter frigidus]|nr:MAG: hypothetical protein DLM50_02395 [Candidatus Eremiobacteraeota bacterium]
MKSAVLLSATALRCKKINPKFLGIATLLICLLRVAAIGAAAPATDISGLWAGTLIRSGQALSVRIAFSREQSGRYTGSFGSDAQAIMDYPLDSVRIAGRRVAFVAGDGDLRFSGEVRDGTIAGTFDGDEGKGGFVLHPTAVRALPYNVEDVAFANGGATLKGTLCVPSSRGRHPAVVLLHGSGPESRWGTNRFIADRLARRRITALIYDKRGSGASTGNWRTVGYEALADDAIAGMTVLAKRTGIDANEIGLWGHSQGGFIAPLIAKRSGHVAFIVAADSNASTNREQDLLRVTNEIRDNGWTVQEGTDALALYMHFLDVASAGGQGYDQLEQDLQRNKDKPWAAWIGVPPMNSWLYKWYPRVANYDSRVYWKAIRVPVLLVYGQHDELSDISGSIATIDALVRGGGGPAVRSIILPHAPHTLHIAPMSGHPFFWWHMASGYPAAEIDWIWKVTHLAKKESHGLARLSSPYEARSSY